MGTYKTNNIQIGGEIRTIEGVFASIEFNLKASPLEALRLSQALYEHAILTKDEKLYKDANACLRKAGAYKADYPESAADPENMPPLYEKMVKPAFVHPRLKTKRPALKMQLAHKYKMKFTQLLQLIYKDNWIVSAEEGELALSDVNYWFGSILNGYNFDAQSGALSNLYTTTDNWKSLAQDINSLANTEYRRRMQK